MWFHQVTNLTFAVSINQNFASSITMPTVYRKLIQNLERVENSLYDVKEMIQQRLGDEWELEWVEEVQKVLEMDAGWALQSFAEMIRYNIQVPASSLRPPQEYVFRQIAPIMESMRHRREYNILPRLKGVVDEILYMLMGIMAATTTA